jgi:hypothetical protein
MMKNLDRTTFLFATLMLLLFMLSIFAGTGLAGFIENDDVQEDDDSSLIGNIAFTWLRIDASQMPILLRPGLSIFALLIVYLGGRSKHKRFNDRTIDADMISNHVSISLKTAHHAAVFNFPKLKLCTSRIDCRYSCQSFHIPKQGGSSL